MISFLPGLFVGEGPRFAEIRDNLDLERWFRVPKSHERRIHGHRHAGVRIVQDRPTSVLARDAHAAQPGDSRGRSVALPHSPNTTLPTSGVGPSQDHQRRARSRKKRPILLAELERRYREATNV